MRSVAAELNMNVLTLKNGKREASKLGRGDDVAEAGRCPQDWTLEERLRALRESHGLEGHALNAWCRERGVFAHHLAQWSADFCAPAEPTAGASAPRQSAS
jgi:hypothetical protein